MELPLETSMVGWVCHDDVSKVSQSCFGFRNLQGFSKNPKQKRGQSIAN